MKASNAKIIKEDAKSFTVQREDGKTFTVAKTAETAPMHKMLSSGGLVPGKAKVAGDSVKNDTVSAPKLSPGEIVIPRSIASDPKKAMAFIQEALAGKHPATGNTHYQGGEIEAMAAQRGVGQVQPTGDESPIQRMFMGMPPQTTFMGAPNPDAAPVDPASQPTSAYTPYASPSDASTAAPAGTVPMAPPDPQPKDAMDAAAQQTNANYVAQDDAQRAQMAQAAVSQEGAPAPTGKDAPILPSNGMATQSQTTTTHETPTGDQKDAFQDLTDRKNDYQSAVEANLTQQAKLNEAKNKEELMIMDQSNAKAEAFQAEKDKEIHSRLQDIHNVEQRFAGMSVDGGRFYGDGVTGSKVMAGIGLLLGSLGGPGSNAQIGQTIQKAIDRDIEVQKANIDKVGKEVDMQRGGLKDYLAITKDMDTAIAAEKARQMEAVGKKFEMIANANPNAAIKQKALEASQPWAVEAAKSWASVGKNISTTVNTTAPMSAEAAKDARSRQINDGKGGVLGYALTPDDAKTVKDITEKKHTSDNSIKQLIDISKMGVFDQQKPSVRAKAQTLHDALVGVMKDPLFGNGKINHAEIDLIGQIIRDPTKVFSLSSSNRTALETVQKQMDESYDSMLKQRMDTPTMKRDAAQDTTPFGKVKMSKVGKNSHKK